MDLLYLAHRIPYPPDKGDKLRAFRHLEHLSKRHRVWCASFVDRPGDERFVDALRKYCEDMATVPLRRVRAAARGMLGLCSGGTLTEAYYRDARMSAVVAEWSRRVDFDAVVAFSSGMAPHALAARARRRVLDLCDLDSRKWLDYAATTRAPRRWLYALEGRRLAGRERAALRSFDAVILITAAEAADLMSQPDGTSPATDADPRFTRLHVVGNGVHIPVLPHAPSSGRASDPDGAAGPQPDREVDAPVVGFVGAMDYLPNIDAVEWFVRNVWPTVRANFPCAAFRIAGRAPARRVRRLAGVPGVHVVGEVADATAEVTACDVSVAPMRLGRGVQNKVLEAMACARPVVLTSRAAKGIAAQHGREYFVADDAETFASAVTHLLGDSGAGARLGTAARAFVAANRRWASELDRLELIVTGATAPVRQTLDTRQYPVEPSAFVPMPVAEAIRSGSEQRVPRAASEPAFDAPASGPA